MSEQNELSRVIMEVINRSDEPLENSEILEKVAKMIDVKVTRGKVERRCIDLLTKGEIRGKKVGPSKKAWIWWRVSMI